MFDALLLPQAEALLQGYARKKRRRESSQISFDFSEQTLWLPPFSIVLFSVTCCSDYA
jgi:hypothetical protein